MSAQLRFDEETARKIETAYRSHEMVEQRRTVRERVNACPGERVLDVGSGPGFLAAELAADVGPHGVVDGVDVSDSMLAIAARRPRRAGAAVVRLHRADATSLPFPDASFDAAVSTQVYEYVADIGAALRELARVLRP